MVRMGMGLVVVMVMAGGVGATAENAHCRAGAVARRHRGPTAAAVFKKYKGLKSDILEC
jgi:hypothetical protein